MKKLFIFPAVIVVAALICCQKQQTEAEKNTEVERQVQDRLAAEHQAEQQQQLSQRQADLDAREKALAEKENAPAATPARRERSESEPATRPHAVSGARPTSGYSTFYTKLDPYGTWFETSDYGYVWQPREAESSRNWRPYTSRCRQKRDSISAPASTIGPITITTSVRINIVLSRQENSVRSEPSPRSSRRSAT